MSKMKHFKPQLLIQKLVFPIFALILAGLACGPLDLGREILSELDILYAAPDGDDSNSCLSLTEACRTLGAAILKAGPRDMIMLSAGDYYERMPPLSSWSFGVYINKQISITGAGFEDTSIVIDAEMNQGIYINRGAFVTIRGVSISNANENGINIRSGGSLTLEDSRVHNNGRLGILVSGGTLTLNNVEVVSNGVLRPLDRVLTEVVSGIKNDGGEITIRDSSISGNVNGGGIYNLLNGTLNIFRTTIENNQGDGLRNNVGTVLIDSSFIHNHWYVGVPVYAAGIVNGHRMTIINSTVSGNQGWGIIGEEDFSDLTISYTTIANSVLGQLNLSSRPNVSLANVLFASITTEVEACRGTTIAVVVTSGNNIATDRTCYGALDVEPDILRLDMPADNGGPTFTMALGRGSPAIDGAFGACPATDQREVTRPYPAGFLCDVGAFEFDPLAFAETISLEGSEVPDLTTVTPAAIDDGDEPDQSTVLVDTLCWQGPGSLYYLVSSVQANTQVELLGLGAQEGWLVIDSPVYPGVDCWIEEEDVDIDPDLDLSALITFPVPLPPTATPTPIITPTPTPVPQVPPNTPTSLAAVETQCNSSDGYMVQLTWTDNATNEAGYRVYHNGNLIATIEANITQYTTGDLGTGGVQNFYVVAFNAAGEAQSNTAQEDGCIF